MSETNMLLTYSTWSCIIYGIAISTAFGNPETKIGIWYELF